MDKIKRYYIVLVSTITLIILVFIYRAWTLAFQSPVPLSMLPQKPMIKRGTIYDINNQELAISRSTVSIGIMSEGVVNPEKTAAQLATVLNLNEDELLEKIKTSESFFYIQKNIPLAETRELQSQKISGVVFEEKTSRYYPNGSLASTVLGFTGVDNEGLAGIEYEFNDSLTISRENEYMGDDLRLTINAYVQHQLEKALKEGLVKSKSRAAIGIISDVHTGKIIAMASLPDFDPNNHNSYPDDNKRNRAIMENIEPGSTFKIFILAALFKENMIDEQKTWFCPGHFQYNNYKLSCGSAHGKETLTDVIKNSCNTGIIEMSWNMPVIKLYDNLKQFGFTSSTNINLPGEENGYIPSPEKWDISLKMSIPIGQGLSVTPIQLVSAANAVANGGVMIRPTIADRIISPDGNVVESFEKNQRYSVLSTETSHKILSYLQHVVRPGGTGFLASIPDYPISGKTSTSIKSDKTGYKKGKYQASFIGFFPGDNPEISIFIWYDEPSTGIYQGGQVAAPIFREILKEIIPIVHKGKIQPTGLLEDKKIYLRNYNKNIMPDLRGKSKKEVMFILWTLFPGEYNITGKGYLVKQTPAPGRRIRAPFNFSLEFSD
jgi:cell division protein FtsI (penicillin-binding protein 3)